MRAEIPRFCPKVTVLFDNLENVDFYYKSAINLFPYKAFRRKDCDNMPEFRESRKIHTI